VTRVKPELVDHMIFSHINLSKAERRWEVLGLERWKGTRYLLMEHRSVSMIDSWGAQITPRATSAPNVAASSQPT